MPRTKTAFDRIKINKEILYNPMLLNHRRRLYFRLKRQNLIFMLPVIFINLLADINQRRHRTTDMCRSISEGKNWIGNNVLIHSQCHLTTGIIIEDWVFIAPLFVGANDPKMLHGRRRVEKFIPKGPHIKFGSGIAVNVTLLPGVVVGRECIVGASSLVTRDVPDFSIVFGAPARVAKKVDESWKLPREMYEEFRMRVSDEHLENFLTRVLSEYKY